MVVGPTSSVKFFYCPNRLVYEGVFTCIYVCYIGKKIRKRNIKSKLDYNRFITVEAMCPRLIG